MDVPQDEGFKEVATAAEVGLPGEVFNVVISEGPLEVEVEVEGGVLVD